MAEHDLDALVVRAPDNVLYLTNFWGMKGYDACVFPREGEPVLISLEASEEDAARTAWTNDVRFVRGYAPDDPRPVPARTLDAALEARARYGRASASSSRSARRRPTAWSASRRRSRRRGSTRGPARRTRCRCSTPRARSRPTQEIERMRLANEICAAAMEHVRGELRPGMKESEAAALWQGVRPRRGHRAGSSSSSSRSAFSLVWSGRGIKTFTATGDRPVQADEPTLFEIWVCADGYWCDHTKLLCPGELRDDYRELEARPARRLRARDRPLPARARRSPSSTASSATGIAAIGYPGQPSHPICHGVGARAHEPPYAHQAGGGTIEEGMVLAIEPGCYWEGGGGLRVEDNFLITADGAEKLSSFPDGVVLCAMT